MPSTKNHNICFIGIEFHKTHLNILNLYLLMVCKFSSLCAIWPIQLSSANSLPKPVILSATSFKKIRKSNGPKTDPGGTPAFNSPILDIAFLINTRCFRLDR